MSAEARSEISQEIGYVDIESEDCGMGRSAHTAPE